MGQPGFTDDWGKLSGLPLGVAYQPAPNLDLELMRQDRDAALTLAAKYHAGIRRVMMDLEDEAAYVERAPMVMREHLKVSKVLYGAAARLKELIG